MITICFHCTLLLLHFAFIALCFFLDVSGSACEWLFIWAMIILVYWNNSGNNDNNNDNNSTDNTDNKVHPDLNRYLSKIEIFLLELLLL